MEQICLLSKRFTLTYKLRELDGSSLSAMANFMFIFERKVYSVRNEIPLDTCSTVRVL